MSSYANNPAEANPFFVDPPLTMVVRHVRITGADETIAEEPTALYRYTVRRLGVRIFPQRQVPAPSERNIPNAGNKKADWITGEPL